MAVTRFHISVAALLLAASCRQQPPADLAAPEPAPSDEPASSLAAAETNGDEDEVGETGDGDEAGDEQCGGEELSVKFYDAGQALAALVTLPDGRRILVDTGENPNRPFCGQPCKTWHEQVRDAVVEDIGDGSIDMVWITHQHSDHHGGLPGIVDAEIEISHYVDNGRDRSAAGVKAARNAAKTAGATLAVVKPGKKTVPLKNTAELRFKAIVPSAWPKACTKKSDPDANQCSIGLEISYCDSSILFTGDAGEDAELAWPANDIDLLQVGHHGSDTSSSTEFLEKVRPNYAVVSCAKIDDGTNAGYCHPRQVTVEALNTAIGGALDGEIGAFDGAVKCKDAEDSNWITMATSAATWYTARDGEVTLVTTGDGTFVRG